MANRTNPVGAFCVAAVLVAAAAFAGTRQVTTERGIEVSHHTVASSRVPVVEVTSRGARSDRPIAFLVHGFQCNKSMMVPLAKYLAARGIDAYAVDLPGHGASLERFSEERARDAAREALEAIAATRGTSSKRIVLIGHSYGANVLARIADGAAPGTMVMLGPSYGGGLSPASAGNLLVLTAEKEHPFITAFARDMIGDATGATVDAPGESSGDVSRGNARAWQVVPATDHVSLLFSADALERTASWVAASLGVGSNSDSPVPSHAVALAALTLGAAVAVAWVTVATCARLAAVETEPPSKPGGPGSVAAIFLIALAIAVLVGRRFTALAFLRLLEGERIASLLAIAGVLMIALGRRLVPWPRVGQVARGIPMATAAFAVVYLAAVLSADAGLYHVSLASIARERYSGGIVLSAVLLPFFAFTGAVLDGVQVARGRGTRGALWAGAANVAVCAAVSMALYLVDARLGRFAGVLGAVCLFAITVGALLSRAARNPAVGVAFSSMTTAWVIAVGFVRY